MRNNGELRVCIQSQTAQNHGVLLDSAETPTKIDQIKLETARNLPQMRELRLAMLRGEQHPHCTRCDQEDACGLPSARKQHKIFWENEFTYEDSVQLTREDGGIDPQAVPIGFFDLRVGNKCNLKCRMCGPSESTAWYEEHFETVGKSIRLYSERVTLERLNGRVVVSGGDDSNWANSAKAWGEIEGNLSGLRLLHVVGGEPLLDERHYSTLEKIISSGGANKVVLDYNTNLTVMPERARELWREFAQVRIGASIDAIGGAFEYIRFPAKWSRVEENFRRLAQEKNKITIWPTTTVQILNAYEILDLYRWRLRLCAEFAEWREGIPLLKIHPVHAPNYYSIQALPFAEKIRLRDAYENFAQELDVFMGGLAIPQVVANRWRGEIAADLRALQSFLFAKDESNALSEFFVKNSKMDNFRKQKFATEYPDLSLRLLGDNSLKGELLGSSELR